MELNIDLLSWFGNFINFLILAYLSINIVNTSCFSVYQLSLSLIGLLASIFIQIISMTVRRYLG